MPGTSTNRRSSRALWVAVLATLAMLGSLVASLPAAAAVRIDGAVKGFYLTTTQKDGPVVGRTQRLHIEWCVPDGTKKGDYFTVQLPKEFDGNMPEEFNLPDPVTKEVVAKAEWTKRDVPLAYTFTFTEYSEGRKNVCGVADFSARLALSTEAGKDIPFTILVNGTTSFTFTTKPRNPEPHDFTKGRKDGQFTKSDQGRINGDSAIQWVLYTPLGPAEKVTITDLASDVKFKDKDDNTIVGNGIEFDCDSVWLRLGSQSNNSALGKPFDDEYPIPSLDHSVTANRTCNESELTVTIFNLPEGKLVRVMIKASLNKTLDASDSPVTIFNTAKLSWTENGNTQEAPQAVRVVQSSASGSGWGDIPAPAISIVKKDAAGNDANTPGAAANLGSPPGSTPLVFTVTNNGTERLRDITVTDTANANGTVTGLSCDFPPKGIPSTGTTWAGPFEPGQEFTCFAWLSGVLAGELHQNTATVTGIVVKSGATVRDDDPYHAIVTPPGVPAVSLVKKDEHGHDANTAGTAVTLGPDGSTVLHLTVTNSGPEPLVNLTVSDRVSAGSGRVEDLSCDFSSVGGPASGTTWDGPLAVGATFGCTARLSGVRPGEHHTDIATVKGQGQTSRVPVRDDDPFHAVVDPTTPGVSIAKDDEHGNAADTPQQAVSLGAAPGSVGLVYTITNTGDEDLTGITVVDKVLANGSVDGLSCDFSPLGGPASGTTWDDPFTVGASFQCTSKLSQVQVGDLHIDRATVTGTGRYSGTPVKDDNPYHATVTPGSSLTQGPTPSTSPPGVHIVKKDDRGNDANTADRAAALGPEGTASLVFTIKNTSAEPLVDVTVADKVVRNGTVTSLSCAFPDGSHGTRWPGPFASGGTFTCTAQLSGVKPGSTHLNESTVTGRGKTTGRTVTSRDPYHAVVGTTTLSTIPSGGADSPSRNGWLIGLGILALTGAGAFLVVGSSRRGTKRTTRQPETT